MPPVSFVLSVLAGNSLRAQEPYTTPSFIPRLLYHKYVRFGQEENKKIAEVELQNSTQGIYCNKSGKEICPLVLR